jgi:hypothetical protein
MTARDVLAGIKARAEAATPGPWEAMCSDSGHSKYELDCSVITSDIGDSICDLEGLDRVTLNERYKGEGDRDAYFIAAARSDLPRLVAAVEAVLDLHGTEKRWQPHPDCEYSWDTEDEARDEIDGEGDPTFFEVCGHCGELEMRNDTAADYRDSIWPCDTVRKITAALEAK